MIISKDGMAEFFFNNLEKRVNKKNIIIMYRLVDECNFYVKYKLLLKFQKIIKNITPCNTIAHSSEWKLVYETYFNQQQLNNLSYTKCNFCNYNFCVFVLTLNLCWRVIVLLIMLYLFYYVFYVCFITYFNVTF